MVSEAAGEWRVASSQLIRTRALAVQSSIRKGRIDKIIEHQRHVCSLIYILLKIFIAHGCFSYVHNETTQKRSMYHHINQQAKHLSVNTKSAQA